MTSPNDPRDHHSTADGGGSSGDGRGPYTWVVGLVAVLAVISVAALLLGGTGGEQSVPTR